MVRQLLSILLLSIGIGTAMSQDVVTIQETEDNIITGARKMIYQDSLILIGDVNCKEIFLINSQGNILKTCTSNDNYGDSLISSAKEYFKDVTFYNIDTYRDYAPKVFENGKITQLLANSVSDFNIVESNVVYSGLFSTLAKQNVEDEKFFMYPLPSAVSTSIDKSDTSSTVSLIKPFENSLTTGLNNCFYYGKYSDTFLSNCLDENLDNLMNDPQRLNFDSIYRFVEYNRNYEPIAFQMATPTELRYRVFVQFLKSLVTQTSDSAFWATFNYYPVVYNLKENTSFALNLPNITNDTMLNKLRYYERNENDRIRIAFIRFKHYLNYEVLSINTTQDNHLIIDILHAGKNEETGKKEQYHILQKYSRSGELLGEKVFPQDGKLGNLQRIAYSAERDEFAFLIFKDEKWLLAYSKEDKVW